MVGTNSGTADWMGSLLTLLERQDALVAELSSLSERQAELIDSSRTDALLSLLADRQRIIDEFATMQTDLTTLTGGMEEKLDALDPAQRDQIRVLINRIGDNLGTVMRRDEQDQRSLEVARRSKKSEIEALDAKQQARNAYLRGPGATAARFADRKG